MDKKQIEEARDRAKNVVDGFSRVKDQQARDVINLVSEIDTMDRTINLLQKRLSDIEDDEDKKINYDSDFFGLYCKSKL